MLLVDPHSVVPVYRQVIEQIKSHIASGVLGPGDFLPAVCRLSSQLGVNPATVSKAYARLESEGLIRLSLIGPSIATALNIDDIKSPEARAGEIEIPVSKTPAEVQDGTPGATGDRGMERDLEQAARIQRALLPSHDLRIPGWDIAFHYHTHGPTGGDYCDLIETADGDSYFIVGDVTGKGLPASLLMAHLHATFRALIPLGMPLEGLLRRVSRSFYENSPAAFFATLVCGRIDGSSTMQICNAGHPAPLLMTRGRRQKIKATGLPIGIFPEQEFSFRSVDVSIADTIVVYTDGITETTDGTGAEYGPSRLADCLQRNYLLSPRCMIAACLKELDAYAAKPTRADDATLLVLRRTGALKPGYGDAAGQGKATSGPSREDGGRKNRNRGRKNADSRRSP